MSSQLTIECVVEYAVWASSVDNAVGALWALCYGCIKSCLVEECRLCYYLEFVL
jgi:hypothetical protein